MFSENKYVIVGVSPDILPFWRASTIKRTKEIDQNSKLREMCCDGGD
jgi:hypothetical protein